MRATDLSSITSDDPASFAYQVICERHPAIVKQIVDDLPYTSSQVARLIQLGEENRSGCIAPLRDGARDSAYWHDSSRDFVGERWTDVPFLWAESFFYRCLLDCVDFHRDGPWYGVDPFRAMKERELGGQGIASFLRHAGTIAELAEREAFAVLLRSALLGNRADLGFQMGSAGVSRMGAEIRLIVDDSESVWSHLSRTRPRKAVLIADNAGLEMICDLLLCDFLITVWGCRVRVDVKPVPYYVSDATGTDVLVALQVLRVSGGWLQDVHDRLVSYMHEDRLRLATHQFYCRSGCYFEAPSDLVHDFDEADVVFVKGDLNYRRLVGDVKWDPCVAFENACEYFPTSVVALRTLKSDVIVGLSPNLVSSLDVVSRSWRSDGSQGVIQSRLV